MAEKFLDRAYGASTPEENKAMYDAWAASYDAEVGENGYATPGRLARALFRFLPDPGEPILDYGCGTGLSGLALKLAGFELLDGIDPSPEMLDRARKTGAYRSLSLLDLAMPPPLRKAPTR